MSISMKRLEKVMNRIAPLRYAYDWDNSGATIVTHDQVNRILLCLDVTEDVLEEAVEGRFDTVLSHHPLIFKPLKKLVPEDPIGALALKAVANGINLYAAHTSFDCAPGGINDLLADALMLRNKRLFLKEKAERYKKIVVFAPFDDENAVKQAMFDAGAGKQGEYSSVSFSTVGTGEFLPTMFARPAIGRGGVMEQVEELRIECFCPAEIADRVAAAARSAHSYEEPVIDVYDLDYPRNDVGLGVVGELVAPMSAESFAKYVKKRLGAASVRYSGNSGRISSVACVGGSGGEFFQEAKKMGIDALVTGEAKYNHFIDAKASGIVLVEAGHYDTERAFMGAMMKHLQKAFNDVQCNISMSVSLNGGRPYDIE